MDIIKQLIAIIIREQQYIIGPLAITQANKVPGLHVTDLNNIDIQGDSKTIMQNLVERYSKLFGQASIQVCKDAIEPMRDKLTPQDIPDILK